MGFRGFRGHGLSVKGLGLGVVGLGLTLIQGSGLPGFLTIINKSGDQGLGFWADVYIPIASKTPLGHSGLALSLFRNLPCVPQAAMRCVRSLMRPLDSATAAAAASRICAADVA